MRNCLGSAFTAGPLTTLNVVEIKISRYQCSLSSAHTGIIILFRDSFRELIYFNDNWSLNSFNKILNNPRLYQNLNFSVWWMLHEGLTPRPEKITFCVVMLKEVKLYLSHKCMTIYHVLLRGLSTKNFKQSEVSPLQIAPPVFCQCLLLQSSSSKRFKLWHLTTCHSSVLWCSQCV